jgi:excisionase family DNA binding protein
MSDQSIAMLTAADAAALLGLKPRTVYALASSDALASHRFGSAVRFDPADIEAYKQSCRLPATTRAAEPEKSATVDPTFAAYFGLNRPRIKWPKKPEPTPNEIRKQRREVKRLRDIERRSLVTFHANKRRTAKLQRTPPWADMAAIRAVYAEAARLTKATGVPHHVDHEIPLQGEFVSGLHVHDNLQILTGTENSKKRNRYEVEV